MFPFLGCDLMSKGEQRIADILQQNRIEFVQEKSFDDLRGGRFRFDFYLPKQNIIIEFDGQQHFQLQEFFQKDRKELLAYQERDRQKNSYCLAHKIKLYRIPFWELDNINVYKDLFNKKFLVKDRWHNDKIWKKFQENSA